MTDSKSRALASRRAQLSPAQRARLEERLRGRATPASDDRIGRRAPDGPAPLSFSQARLWFLQQLEPENPFYNESVCVRLLGPLDRRALTQALAAVVERHEMLRTRLYDEGGVPVQVVEPTGAIPVAIDALGHLPEAEREAELQRRALAFARTPVALDKGPLVRARLTELAPQHHVFHLSMHHVVADGWSLMRFIQEMGLSYEASVAGTTVDLPRPEVRYRDFAVWQREWLSGPKLAAQLQYWRTQLASAIDLRLPTEHARPARQSFRGARRTAALSPELTSRLRRLAQDHDATLFMVLLAGFQALLQRLSGQSDLAVGVPIANRHRPEIEGVIGFFVNTIVIRADLAGDPSFAELLGRVREATLGAQEHQDLPFERVVEALRPSRGTDHNPLFQVMFLLHDVLHELRGPSGLRILPLELDHQTAKFDLTLFMRDEGERLTAMFEYAADLFSAQTIDRWLDQLVTLLDAFAAAPARPISRAPLLGAAEQDRILTELAGPALAAPRACLHEAFAAHAARAPRAPAVTSAGTTWSYGELDARANRIAHQLRAWGVGPESHVAILIDRSTEVLAAVLGVWKAGAAYLPLDPKHPPYRQAALLEQVRPPALVTVSRLRDRCPAQVPHVLELDDPALEAQPATPPPATATLGNAAYVIFTSGSTGLPKGVVVEHRQLASYVAAVSERFAPGLGAVAATVSTIAADLGHTALFPPLALGGCVDMIAEDCIADADALAAHARAHPYDAIKIVPGHLDALLEAADAAAIVPRKTLVLGGDSASWALIDRVHALAPGCRIFNHYGPTETTVGVIAGPLEQGAGRPEIPPLGRPLAGTRIYLLDAAMQLVPIGVLGEVYIGGTNVARGYLRQPARTAERFVPSPFGPPGARLYRTGDLARWLPDGRLVFAGRADAQIKLRGYRIELGEIKAALLRQPLIREAHVAVQGPATDRRIVGYVVPSAAEAAAPAPGTPGGPVERPVERRVAAPAAGPAAGPGDAPVELVSSWCAVFEDLYRTSEQQDADPTFNLTGWISSYTGEQIPAEQMSESVERTIEAIRGLGARRILELGCGIGLLVHRLAPHCERLVATDFSAEAVAYLKSRLGRLGPAMAHVEVLQRDAQDLTGLPPRSFDTVVLNSVIQYFPSLGYLGETLRRAAEVVDDGGAIFLGDVRSLPLLEAFHAGVELARASDGTTAAELRQRIARAVTDEEELILDPTAFAQLALSIPRIRRVTVAPKRGHLRSELSVYRHDVVLHVGDAALSALPVHWQPWAGQDAAAIRARIERDQPLVLALGDVGNARLGADRRLLARLAEAEPGDRVADLRRLITAEPDPGLDPEALYAAAAGLPYTVELSWARHDEAGAFDVVYRRHDAPPGPVSSPGTPAPRTLANDPTFGMVARRLTSQLRDQLAAELPDYMIPSSFVVLAALPRTRNGKIDAARLPRPEQRRADRDANYTAPRDGLEELLAGLWGEVLGLDRLGVFDDFFALGGHSLLATQLVARVRKSLGIDLPLRVLFDQPTVAGLAHAVAAALRASEGDDDLPLQPAPPAPHHPLSHAQQRFWFLDRLVPGNTAYNLYYYCRLRGRLDRAAAKEALERLVRRQGTLRTRFVLEGGAPVQIVEPAGSIELPLVDLRDRRGDMTPAQREAELAALAAAEVARPFDLAAGPPFRAQLVALGPDDHALLLTVHHIASDAWSRGVFVRELAAHYQACIADRASALPELPVQYVDYARWQRQRLQGPMLDRQLAWWKQALHGAPTTLDLPVDRPRGPLQTYAGAAEPLRLSPQLYARIGAVARAHGATPFMLLLAAFGLLLQRYTRSADVLIGSPIAGRTRVELEPILGFFANTLVFRVARDGDPSFGALLAQVRDHALGAYAHQDLPFERLVEALDVPVDRSRSPLFQVMFVLQNTPPQVPATEDLSLVPLAFHSQRTMFDLTLVIGDAADRGLAGVLEYNTDLFDPATAQRMVRHLENLVAALVSAPELPVSRHDVLDPAERAQQLVAWNATAVAHPEMAGGVHALFEAQARRTPDAIAVIAGQAQQSYAELERQSHALAVVIREAVGSGGAVGVALERGLPMIEIVVAILRAGAACVPLDPAYPAARLANMVEDARPGLIITSPAIAAQLPAVFAPGAPGSSGPLGVPVVLADDLAARAQAIASAALPALPPVPGEAVAYVMFTSGSTGRPKGVALPHRALVNLVAWHVDHLLGGVRTLQFASLGFDASFHEMFAAFASGGALVVVPEPLRRDVAGLARLLSEQRVEKVILPVVVLDRLAHELLRHPDLPIALAEITVTGEQLHVTEAMRRWFRAHPGVRFHNHYGPSETHVVTAYTLDDDPDAWPSHPSIGGPIDNTAVYVLDPELRPCPLGSVGELYLGGEMLAHGYANRPGITAERFLPSPFVAGARLYRTGDLVRFDGDGRLVFLGRGDHQVKIRGHRVEPAEIEATLEEHPQVREALVIARGTGSEQRHLVAYVIPRDPAAGSDAALRAHLRERLPEPMIPSAFVPLAAFPLTTNGKVDRAALPAPDAGRRATRDFVPPRNNLEQALTHTWEEVLGLRPIGVTDDFFEDLGGHSLLAVTLLARMEADLGVALPLARFFETKTIEGVAAAGSATGDGAARVAPGPLVSLRAGGEGPPLVLLHPVDGTVGCYVDLAQALADRLAVCAIQAPSLVSDEPPTEDLVAMAARYAAIVEAAWPEGPYRLAGWSMGGAIAYEMARQLRERGRPVELLAVIDRSATPTGDDAELLVGLVKGLATRLGRPIELSAGELRGQEPGAQIDRVRARLRDAGHAAHAAELVHLRRFFEHYAPHMRALSGYRPGPLDLPILVVRAGERGRVDDPSLGWAALTGGQAITAEVSGTHHEVIRGPAAARVAELIVGRVRQVRRLDPGGEGS